MILEQPKCYERIDHKQYGYRDVLILEEKQMYFALNSEMVVTNRLDSYLRNAKLPWKREKLTVENVDLIKKSKISYLELHQKQRDGLNKLVYTKVWEFGFHTQAICIGYSEKLKKIAVGQDDGHIYLFDFPVDYDSDQTHKLSAIEKVHKRRVMRIWFCDEKMLMYSIGEDKYLKSYELKSNQIQSCKSADLR